MVVAMIVVLFGSGAAALLAVAVGDGGSQGVASLLVCIVLGLGAALLPYLMIWRYYVVVGPDTLADARSRRRPKQVVPRAAITQVTWVDRGGTRGGLFLGADGGVVLAFEPYIAKHQVKKIAAMLDVPFT